MDVVYFLNERTRFIRYFYDQGCAAFRQTIADIEAKRPPFEEPPFDPDQDSPEPPFLEEWGDADTGIQVVGMAAVSMLSDTLKLYFHALKQEWGFKPSAELKKRVFDKEGFLAGYKVCLADLLETDRIARSASISSNRSYSRAIGRNMASTSQ